MELIRVNFLPPTNGAYVFHGLQDFTNRITHLFDDSKGKPTFMCFDAACLLPYAAGVRADSLESDLGSKNIIYVTPERELLPLSREALNSAVRCSPICQILFIADVAQSGF